MAEMQKLKVEVVRYNPEVDAAPHSAFYESPRMRVRKTSLAGCARLYQRQPGTRPELSLNPAAWRSAVPAA